MMPAGKHFDPILGIDIHIVQPPGPVPPLPIPHPFIGILIDPMDYAPYIGATVKVNGIPRAQAGTSGKCLPVHIPLGGVFVKPPANECEMFMGSSTVSVDGDAFSYLALPALSCQDIGMPPIPRLKKKGGTKSLVLPTSVMLPIPGPPVVVGGSPTISLMGILMKLGMAGLFKGLKKLAKTKAFKRAMGAFKKAKAKAFENMKPGFLKCNVLKAEPVDITTGEVVVEQQDFHLPWPLSLTWTRHYRSQSTRSGLCGVGWETPADARLVFEADGAVVFYDGTPGNTLFPSRPTQGPVQELVDGAVLSQTGETYHVRLKSGLTYHFPTPAGTVTEVVVERITNLCGQSLTFRRDATGLRDIVSNVGPRLEVLSSAGRIEQLVLHHPDEEVPRLLVRYEYDHAEDLRVVYDALDAPYRFEYREHLMTKHTDRNGLSFYYEFDRYTSKGRVVHAWGDGGLYNYKFAYELTIGQVNVTDSLGYITTTELDERNLPIKETNPLGGVTSFEYDEVGRTSAVVDPGGLRTEYHYDRRGNLVKLIRPDGVAILTEYDNQNNAIAITDPNGDLWKQEWNSRGLLVKQITPLGNTSRYEYDTRGLLVGSVNPNGARTELNFDLMGNLTTLTDALGNPTLYAYDVLGNAMSKTDPLNRRTVYQYDAKGRLIGVRLPSGATIGCAYDAQDNLTRYVDENGAVTRLEYFGLGEIAKRIQADGHNVQYHYDTEERLIGVANQRGEMYHLKRDALGRIVEEVDYWGQSRSYGYDASGYIMTSTDPLGQTIQYATDPLGRIVKKLSPQGQAEEFAYDGNGNLIGTKNAHVEIARNFDAEGRLSKEVQGTFTIKSVYDASGNRIVRETSLGNSVAYEFDTLGQAISIRINADPPIEIERDAAGCIIHEKLTSRLSRRFRYSADGYLTDQAVSTTVLANESPLSATRFEYDAVGNLTQRSENQYGTDVYRYDPLGQITEHLNPQHRITRYLTDPAGDRLMTRIVDGTHKHVAGGDVVKGEWSREGEYEGTYYRFDRAGNLAERREGQRVLHLVWDANQRVIESHTHGTVTRYGYDPLGRRLFKETGDRRTLFYWDGHALVGEALVVNQPREPISSNGVNVVAMVDLRAQTQPAAPEKVREYLYYPETFEPLALVEGEGTSQRLFHYHNDLNGCPTMLTDVAGGVRWAASYTTWGKISKYYVNAVENPLRLQGQYEDCESELVYNRHRYFDPYCGMFVSHDLIGLAGGLNTYQYALNSIKWIDPLGLNCTPRGAQQKVKKGQGPKQITRIDAPESSIPGSQWHAHGANGGARNLDGSIHDADPKFSKKTLAWLAEHGWSV